MFAIGLSVVFSLTGWSPPVPAEFLVLRGTQVPPRRRVRFRVRGCHPLRPGFPSCSATFPACLCRRSYNPGRGLDRPGLGSCAFARHYLRNRSYFLFLRVLRCFSSPRSPRASRGGGIAPAGFPHSDIRGWTGICPCPRLFAACHVLHRLREPQASPVRPSSLSLCLSPQCITFGYSLDSRLISLASTFRTQKGPVTKYSHFSRSQHVNDLFFSSPVVPGRLELPTSTLSV